MTGKSSRAHLAYLAVHLGPFCDYGTFFIIQSNGMERSIKNQTTQAVQNYCIEFSADTVILTNY
jgi:hypothetical protein